MDGRLRLPARPTASLWVSLTVLAYVYGVRIWPSLSPSLLSPSRTRLHWARLMGSQLLLMHVAPGAGTCYAIKILFHSCWILG